MEKSFEFTYNYEVDIKISLVKNGVWRWYVNVSPKNQKKFGSYSFGSNKLLLRSVKKQALVQAQRLLEEGKK